MFTQPVWVSAALNPLTRLDGFTLLQPLIIKGAKHGMMAYCDQRCHVEPLAHRGTTAVDRTFAVIAEAWDEGQNTPSP